MIAPVSNDLLASGKRRSGQAATPCGSAGGSTQFSLARNECQESRIASALAVARVAVVETVAEEVAEAFEAERKQSKAARSQRGRASPSAWPRGYAGA